MFDDMEYNYWDQSEKQATEARNLYEDGQLTLALEKIDSALYTNSENERWHFNKGLILDSLERFDEAIISYKKANEIKPDDIEIMNSLAVDYTRTGHYDLALHIFNGIEQIAPDFEPCYCNRIITYTEIGDHEKAEQMFYLAQQIDPDCALCYYNIGNSLFSRGKYKKAVWCWERTALLEPQHPHINYRIAQAHWADGNMLLAKKYFLKEMRINPGNLDVILDFGIYLLHCSELESAKEKFQRVLEFDPYNSLAYHFLGESALIENDEQKAKTYFQLAVQHNNVIPGPRYRLAQLCFKQGHLEQAKQYIKEEILVEPDDCDVLLSMGILLLELDLYDHATHCFLKVTDNVPTNSMAFYYLGLVQAFKNEYIDSIQFLKHAIELAPKNTELLIKSSIIYYFMGYFEDAKFLLDTCLKIKPKNRNARKIKRLINIELILFGIKNYFSKFRRDRHSGILFSSTKSS